MTDITYIILSSLIKRLWCKNRLFLIKTLSGEQGMEYDELSTKQTIMACLNSGKNSNEVILGEIL